MKLLRKISSEVRNSYDRFHAEPAFSQELGDKFLGRYAEESLKGLSDLVLLPAHHDSPPEAFLAISHLKKDSSDFACPMTRVLLTAVGAGSKGWHLKLVAETIQYSKSINARYVHMTTQSTNRAVFRTNEKLGFKLGGVEHVFSISN